MPVYILIDLLIAAGLAWGFERLRSHYRKKKEVETKPAYHTPKPVKHQIVFRDKPSRKEPCPHTLGDFSGHQPYEQALYTGKQAVALSRSYPPKRVPSFKRQTSQEHDDLGVRSITPFEHGGLNMHNNSTSYFNL